MEPFGHQRALTLVFSRKDRNRCIVSNKLDATPFRRSFRSRDAAPEPDRAGMAAFERRAARPVSEQRISGCKTCQLEVVLRAGRALCLLHSHDFYDRQALRRSRACPADGLVTKQTGW